MHLFVFLAFVLCSYGQINFLPTEYSSIVPFQFDAERTVFAIELQLCDTTIYQGCNMTATLNLPFTQWSVDDGTYVAFQIADQADNCATPLCSNNPAFSSSPNTCSFIYKPAIGTRLFAYGTAGRSAGFQATFNMKIDCSHPMPTPEPTIVKSTSKAPAACPTPFSPSKRSLKLVVPGSVPTTPETSRAAKYSFSVCSAATPYAKVTYSLQAVDPSSAFATYFCTVSNCNTATSQDGWFDNSGTATNLVELTHVQQRLLYFTIYGWGAYQGNDRYLFNIQITDEV